MSTKTIKFSKIHDLSKYILNGTDYIKIDKCTWLNNQNMTVFYDKNMPDFEVELITKCVNCKNFINNICSKGIPLRSKFNLNEKRNPETFSCSNFEMK